MATRNGGDLVSNLNKVYGIYTGGFVGFVVLLAILEQVGVPNKIIGYLFVAMTIGVYAAIGFITRTMQVSEYYVAGRRVPAMYNGMATAADWMSAASFIAMAGGLYANGYDALAFVLGWTGGYVLVATLIAPYLRKFGAYTVPDFLGARFGGDAARTIGIIVLFCCSFTYIVGQVTGVGTIASRFLGISYEVAVFVGLIGILVCSMLGGMRAVTWTQVAQYIVLIVAYLVPVVILSAQVTGIPIPQLMYGEVLQRITELEATKPALAGVKAHVVPFTNMSNWNFFALIICLMIGTASLPHVLMRYFTTPSVREARKSVGWSLLFIFLLYFTAPAYAAFAKFEIYNNVLGTAIADLPNWVKIYSDLGLMAIKDANADGILQLKELTINPDVIVIATPEIAGLPYVIAGLVAAGGLAAALSTADGLLLAIANALSHDIYYRMVDPKASTQRRLVVARVLLIVVAILAAVVASTRPGGILALVAWAFSLAAAGLFPALVLGVWWSRTTSAGAVVGMAAGFLVTLFYLAATKYFGMPVWFGTSNISAGIFGIPVGFIVTIVVSLMTPEPSAQMQAFVRSLRIPRGGTLMEEKDAAA
ncbi:MAG: sodium:solute symporter family protein [Alphaproteobacteria bacterium]